MEYMTIKEAAAKWNYAERSVQNWCANGKLQGAQCIGGQWLIPSDATPPPDGRTKKGKESKNAEPYKFPVFLYTRAYKDQTLLTPEEQRLLQAQILHLEGNHFQSIIICNELLGANPPTYMRAGIWLTIGVDSFLMGLPSRYEEAVARLEEIATGQTEHKEDYLLLAAALQFYVKWSPENLSKIRPDILTIEATWYYQMMLTAVCAVAADGITLPFSRLLESELPFLEKEGITPLLYYYYSGLGTTGISGIKQEEKEALLQRGVALAVQNNWVSNLHRFYNFAPASLDKVIKTHGETYYRELHKAVEDSLGKWNLVRIRETGSGLVNRFTPEQFELIWLLPYGYTNEDIALCLNVTVTNVKQRLKELMEITETPNKTALIAYVKKMLRASKESNNK